MPIAVTNADASGRILGIRKLQIAPPFDGRSLVYRTGEFACERDPYAEFLDLPADQLLAAMRAWWQANGHFRAVVEPDSALKADLLVEISVTQMFGDFRQPERPLAVMSLRFAFFDVPHGIPGNLVFQHEYDRKISLPTPTATALVAGWNQALTGILAQVSSDLRPAELGGKN
jgi:cholesterol transport system auxiliary component